MTLTATGPDRATASMSNVVAGVLDSLAAQGWDGSGAALVRAVGRAGLFSRCLTADGRQPLRPNAFRDLIDALAARAPSGPTLSCVVHAATFLPLVHRLAHPDVAAGAADGTVVGTIAATDAGVAGSDVAGVRTSVHLDGDRIVLHGEKDWIANATFADYFAVVARHRPGRHFSSLSLVLVPADAPGVTRRAVETDVMAGAGLGRVRFDDVVLPATALLGRPGRGFAHFVEQMSAERLAGGVWAVAAIRRVLADTVRYLRARDVGGEPLWARSAVRHEVARAAVRLRMLDALVSDIVRTAERDERLPAVDTAVLKAALGPIVVETVDRCLQLHGAQGLLRDEGLLARLGDLRTFAIAGGATETMLDVVAAHVDPRGGSEQEGTA